MNWLSLFKKLYVLLSLCNYWLIYFTDGGRKYLGYMYSSQYVSTYYFVDELWKTIQQWILPATDYWQSLPPQIVIPQSYFEIWTMFNIMFSIFYLLIFTENRVSKIYERISIISGCLYMTYYFLVTEINYLNHMYLFVIMGWLVLLCSVFLNDPRESYLRERQLLSTVPIIVYLGGALAKIDTWSDWIDRCEPLLHWLGSYKAYACFASYAGLIVDFVIPQLFLLATLIQSNKLLWMGYGVALTFHLTSASLFNIGLFPYICLWLVFSLFFVPSEYKPWSRINRSFLLGCLLIISFVLFMTFRPYGLTGYNNSLVSDEGQQFSWRMKLRERITGHTTYEWRCSDVKGETPSYVLWLMPWYLPPHTFDISLKQPFINKWQWKRIVNHPDSLRRFSYWWKKHLDFYRVVPSWTSEYYCGLHIDVWTEINYHDCCYWTVNSDIIEISSSTLSHNVEEWI